MNVNLICLFSIFFASVNTRLIPVKKTTILTRMTTIIHCWSTIIINGKNSENNFLNLIQKLRKITSSFSKESFYFYNWPTTHRQTDRQSQKMNVWNEIWQKERISLKNTEMMKIIMTIIIIIKHHLNQNDMTWMFFHWLFDWLVGWMNDIDARAENIQNTRHHRCRRKDLWDYCCSWQKIFIFSINNNFPKSIWLLLLNYTIKKLSVFVM